MFGDSRAGGFSLLDECLQPCLFDHRCLNAPLERLELLAMAFERCPVLQSSLFSGGLR